MKNEVTAKKFNIDPGSENFEWGYFIDGVYYSQPGYPTQEKALEAGYQKLKEIKNKKKK